MQIDRILYPIYSLGPGRRLVIWTIGCTRGCKNCTNPELWNSNPLKEIPVDNLLALIRNRIKDSVIDGITITGGEPFNEEKELRRLIQGVSTITGDILLFTGFQLEELYEKKSEDVDDILHNIAVLIDGEYIEELNDNHAVLRGSRNQQIYIINPNYASFYDNYSKGDRMIQNIFYKKHMISVGIHNRIRGIE